MTPRGFEKDDDRNADPRQFVRNNGSDTVQQRDTAGGWPLCDKGGIKLGGTILNHSIGTWYRQPLGTDDLTTSLGNSTRIIKTHHVSTEEKIENFHARIRKRNIEKH